MTLTFERTSTTLFDPQREPKRRPQRVVRQHGAHTSHHWNDVGAVTLRRARELLALEPGGHLDVLPAFHAHDDVPYGVFTPGRFDHFGALRIDTNAYSERLHRSVFTVCDAHSRIVRIVAFEPREVEAVVGLGDLADLLSVPFAVEEVQQQESPLDRAQNDLGRLRDGWAGPDSLAPLPAVLADLAALVTVLPAHADVPDFEVDGGDGTITVVWNSGQRSFSLFLAGNGKVVGVMSPSNGYKAWTLPIAMETQIAQKLEDDRLSSFLGI